MVRTGVFPFYEMGINVHTELDVIEYYNDYYDEILESNKEHVTKGPPDEHYSYSPNLIEIFKKDPLIEYLSVEKTEYVATIPAGSTRIVDSDETYFVEIPFVGNNEEWVYENGEVRVYFEQCKTLVQEGQDCPEYEKVSRLATKLKHVVTESGVIYFGGVEFFQ